METQITNITQAFRDSKQYAIPSYQRNYVWTRKGQWEPLWEDVKALATRWIKGGQKVEPHFLGTLIAKDIGTRRFINRSWVVDGQQRLTTLQILLPAARTAFTHFRNGDMYRGISSARQIVHRIENLTLVTKPMNSKLRDTPWSFKADPPRKDNLAGW